MTGVVMGQDEERSRDVDLSVPLYMDSEKLCYIRPVLGSDIAGFIKPYTAESWVMMVVTMGVVATCIVYSQRITNATVMWRVKIKRLPEETVETVDKPFSSLWISILWTLAAALGQATSWLPERGSVRLVAGQWLVIALIFATVYRANLKAMLIKPRLQLPFSNMEELVQTDIPCFIYKGNILHQNVEAAVVGSTMYRLKKQLRPHHNLNLAVRDLLAGENALFASYQGILSVMHATFGRTRTCPIYFTKENYFDFRSLVLGFPKGSPLRDRVNHIVTSLQEFGILNGLLMNQIRHARLCLKHDSSDTTTLRPLEMGDFLGVFSVYAGGITLAGIVLLLEILLARGSDGDIHPKIPREK